MSAHRGKLHVAVSSLHFCETVQGKKGVVMVISEWLPVSVSQRHGQSTS